MFLIKFLAFSGCSIVRFLVFDLVKNVHFVLCNLKNDIIDIYIYIVWALGADDFKREPLYNYSLVKLFVYNYFCLST